MKYLTIFFLLLTISIFPQNLKYTTSTVDSADSVITLDLGLDTDITSPSYMPGGDEYRIIGIVFEGTWTNTTFDVEVAVDPDSTYYDVYERDGTQIQLTMASNQWIQLDPWEFAGLRYVTLRGAAAEGDERTYWIVKRIY